VAVEDDQALSGGPYLRLALPEEASEYVPLNASSLFREWTLLLDPLDAMRSVAPGYLQRFTDWFVTEKFVIPEFGDIELLRRAARDEGIRDAFGAVPEVRLNYPERAWSPRFVSLLYRGRPPEDEENELLAEPALAVLLGLAVLTAIDYEVGLKGRATRNRRDGDAGEARRLA
jgi:hypothetical protein